MKSYLNFKDINLENIARELYDFNSRGALSVPHVLTSEALSELQDFVKKSRLEKVTERVGSVYQYMNQHYFSIRDNCLEEDSFFPLKKLIQDYALIYETLAHHGEFDEPCFNSVGIHHYYEGSQGITPHQDFARDRDLISIFIIEGRDPLYICKNRKKKDSVVLDQNPGSLILLRAARHEDEQRYRPIHYLNPVSQERYTIIFRRSL